MRRALLVAALVAVGLYGWLDVANRARTDRGPKYHRSDFTAYQAAARALVEGTDPYEARNPRGLEYLYPPLLAVLLMPVAGVPPRAAAFLFFLLSAALLAAALRLLGRRALYGGLLCAPFLHESFERGQVTVLLLALQLFALAAMLRRRWFLAALSLAVGTALRLTPALPAVALGLGLVAARAGLLRYALGFAAGCLLCFVAIPAAVLGPARATDVTARFVEKSRQRYAAAPGEFAGFEGINEYRYKNQSVRRVLATWTGWGLGARFEDEQPALSPGAARAVDIAAYAVAGACLLVALLVGWTRLRAPDPGAFALVVILPLFMTRYTWPTHYVMALPAVAFAGMRGRIAFAAGTAAFYLAHWPPLERLGAAGPLLLGAIVLAVPPKPPSVAVPGNLSSPREQ